MSEEPSGDENLYLTAQDMQGWAQQEIRDATKALELRKQDLEQLSSAYSSGAISPEQANELHSRYLHRWGEALPGLSATEGVSDAQILEAADRAAEAGNGSFVSPGETHTRYTNFINAASRTRDSRFIFLSSG